MNLYRNYTFYMQVLYVPLIPVIQYYLGGKEGVIINVLIISILMINGLLSSRRNYMYETKIIDLKINVIKKIDNLETQILILKEKIK